jgi:HAD superfamily hydrolase (TIGR01509 family)
MASGKIRAVVFDMDGVLIDAKEWHFEALNKALGLFGHVIDRYDHLVTYDGLPTRRKLELLSRDSDLPKALHGFINEMKQLYTMEVAHARCRPSFAREYALSRLRADGYILAVASNSIRRTVELLMEKSRLRPYLTVLMSNEDVEQPKPDPEIYQKTFSALGVPAPDCLVVEDNEHGVQSARASGAHVMVVDSVNAVTYDNIVGHIHAAEGASC